MDVLAPRARLVVKVDGSYHARRRGADGRRDENLDAAVPSGTIQAVALRTKMFKVADHEYDVTYACLELFDRSEEDTVCWGLKILGKGRGGQDDMSKWKPAILSDVLLETKAGRMSHWYDIAGTTIAWNEPKADPQALFEVNETAAIYECQWQFVAVSGNTRVRLIFDGMVDIDSDHQKVPLHIDTLLGVAPWPMAYLPEQQCLDRYRHLGFEDPVEFRLQGRVSSLVFTDQ